MNDSATPAGEPRSDDFALERFQPLLGQAFSIAADAEVLEAVLVEATDLREVQGAGRRSRQFSLVWRGAVRLEQRIYRVSHPVPGAMELFLVTIGAGPEGFRYEAVFT